MLATAQWKALGAFGMRATCLHHSLRLMTKELINPAEALEFADIDPAFAGMVWALIDYDLKQLRDPIYREKWFKAFHAIWDMLYPESVGPSVPVESAREGAPTAMPDPIPIAAPKRRGRPPKLVAVSETTREETHAIRTTETMAVSEDAEDEDDDKPEPDNYDDIRQPHPYRGSKECAQIILDIIHRIKKPARVWLRGDGRVKICGPEYRPGPDETHVGTYTVLNTVTEIRSDLHLAGP